LSLQFKIDGIVGEVLFWALRHCLGNPSYTPEVHNAWVKVYSRLLREIVPEAVRLELNLDETKSNTKAGGRVVPPPRDTSREMSSLSTAELPLLELYRSLHENTDDETLVLESDLILKKTAEYAKTSASW
jgi:hypothetical protein